MLVDGLNGGLTCGTAKNSKRKPYVDRVWSVVKELGGNRGHCAVPATTRLLLSWLPISTHNISLHTHREVHMEKRKWHLLQWWREREEKTKCKSEFTLPSSLQLSILPSVPSNLRQSKTIKDTHTPLHTLLKMWRNSNRGTICPQHAPGHGKQVLLEVPEGSSLINWNHCLTWWGGEKQSYSTWTWNW